MHSLRRTLRPRWLSTASAKAPLPEGWAKRATKELKGKDPSILVVQTPEGIPLKPLCKSLGLDRTA